MIGNRDVKDYAEIGLVCWNASQNGA